MQLKPHRPGNEASLSLHVICDLSIVCAPWQVERTIWTSTSLTAIPSTLLR